MKYHLEALLGGCSHIFSTIVCYNGITPTKIQTMYWCDNIVHTDEGADMNKIIGLTLGVVAMVALSGCNSAGNEYNIKIQRQVADYIETGDDSKSCVEVKNSVNSDYDIYNIWSGPVDGAYKKSFPNDTPPDYIAPGKQRTFCSANCGADEWKIKVEDERGAVAEGKYHRECGYKELLIVTTKY